MKKTYLLSAALLTVITACSDPTSTSPHSALTVKSPSPLLKGNTPPPPVDAAITIEVASSIRLAGVFTGKYFSNGSLIESQLAAEDIGDPTLAFAGTAWLKFDNSPLSAAASASANARFQISNDKLFGSGTFTILGHIIRIVQVTSFIPNPACNVPGEPCAQITFEATVDGEPGHIGSVQAYDNELCRIVDVGTPIFTDAVVLEPYAPGSQRFVCGNSGVAPQ
jgi:hypothetical protein